MDLFGDYGGTDFLIFYAGLLLAAFIAAKLMPTWLREDGTPVQLTDPEEIAFLAGGRLRFVDAVIAGLLGREALQIAGKAKLAVAQPNAGNTDAERAVLGLPGKFRWSKARRLIGKHSGNVEEALVRKGLLVPSGDRLTLRLVPVLPYLALMVLGIYRLRAGAALGEPVEFLLGLVLLTGVLAIMRVVKFDPRTRAGIDALKEGRQQAERLRSAPTGGETGLAVGLFGTAVLVGTPYAPFHTMRQSSGAGTSHSDSDSGGSGCGGGGCGGCGG